MDLKLSSFYSPILMGICWRIFAKPQKFLTHREYTELQKLCLEHPMSIGF